MVTTVLAMLSILIPFIGILSSASVGLVTLRLGSLAGARVILLSTLACAVLMGLTFGNPLPALGFLLVLWVPVALLGWLLRQSRSLDLTTQVGLAFGILAILVQYISMGEPATFWREYLGPMAQRFIEAGLFDRAQSVEVIEQLSSMMCGLVAVGFLLQLLFSLYVARWWQAMLYNPGGFATEYHQLRMHRLVGVAGAATMLLALLPEQTYPAFIGCLGTVFLGLMFLQGLAVVHCLLKDRKSTQLWLVMTYLMLIVFLPQMVLALVCTGLLDIWIDFRTRFRSGLSG
jgi:flagellar biosynthesis protein FlhB